MASTVVAVFSDLGKAGAAIQALREEGFPPDAISLVVSDAEGEYARQLSGEGDVWTPTGPTPIGEGASTGAEIGAALGGLGGILIGLGALAIPGIGPIVAAGPLAAAFSGLVGAGVGAAAGAVTGGVIGALVEAGIPEEQAHIYVEEVRRGRPLVAVQVEDRQAARVADLLNRFGPEDLGQRA